LPARLTGARFTGTSFTGTSFTGTSFTGTRFTGTRFTGTFSQHSNPQAGKRRAPAAGGQRIAQDWLHPFGRKGGHRRTAGVG
jgi:hypothetical protein